MDIRICPKELKGEVHAIASKSQAHRALICAAFADGASELVLNTSSKDIEATLTCLKALGMKSEKNGNRLKITPVELSNINQNTALNCGESGSTLRFLLPVAAAVCEKAWFTGEGRLPERPIAPLTEQMKQHGAEFSSDKLPLSVSKLKSGGRFLLPGNVSSQFASGLIMAAPLLKEEVRIEFECEPESLQYIEMTIEMVKNFGIEVRKSGNAYIIPAGQKYSAIKELKIEGDWSNAAFWLCAGALGGEISLIGLDISSAQGDKAIVDILKRMGADIEVGENTVSVRKSALKGCIIDARETPDLIPVLAAAAALSEGETRIIRAERLRIKESDRLKTTTDMLLRLGADITELEDGLIIRGKRRLKGGKLFGHNDHRIVMSAAVAAIGCEAQVIIEGAEAADKSYPGFFSDYSSLGGNTDVLLR